MNLLTNQNSLIACKYVTFTRALFDLSNKKQHIDYTNDWKTQF